MFRLSFFPFPFFSLTFPLRFLSDLSFPYYILLYAPGLLITLSLSFPNFLSIFTILFRALRIYLCPHGPFIHLFRCALTKDYMRVVVNPVSQSLIAMLVLF